MRDGEQLTERGSLYVLEGPFDALKIDFYGQEFGIRATCLFTANITDAQKELLERLSDYYDLYILNDEGAFTNALDIAQDITCFIPFLKPCLAASKTQEEMTRSEVIDNLA